MRLSIVTATFNQGHLINQTIESILRQPAGLDLEYLIIDGGSKDNTKEVVESYRSRIEARGILFRFISEPDRGQSDAINKGSLLATGELTTNICSDDFYEPNILEKIIDQFSTHPNALWGYGGWQFVDYEGRAFTTIRPKHYSHHRLKLLCTIGQPSCFYRTEFLRRVGLLDEKLHLSMDYDLWLRMAAQSDPIVMPFVVSNMRYYMQTKSATKTISHLLQTLSVQRRHTHGLLLRIEQLFYFLRGYLVVLLKRDPSHRAERFRVRAQKKEMSTDISEGQ